MTNKITSFIVGHVYVPNPRPDHPTSYKHTVGELAKMYIKLDGVSPSQSHI